MINNITLPQHINSNNVLLNNQSNYSLITAYLLIELIHSSVTYLYLYVDGLAADQLLSSISLQQ